MRIEKMELFKSRLVYLIVDLSINYVRRKLGVLETYNGRGVLIIALLKTRYCVIMTNITSPFM